MTLSKDKIKVLLVLDKELNERLEKAVSKLRDSSKSRYVRDLLADHFGLKK